MRYMVKRNLFCVLNFPTGHPQHGQYLCWVILVNQVYVEEWKSSLKEEFPQFQLARLTKDFLQYVLCSVFRDVYAL